MSTEIRDLIWQLIPTLLGSFILYHILFFFLKKWARQKKRIIPALLSKYMYYPGLTLMLLLSTRTSVDIFQNYIALRYYNIINHSFLIALAVCLGFILMRVISIFREIALRHYTMSESVDYSLRKAKTKFQLIQRVLNFMIFIATFSVILMTFRGVREVGTTLLASAGVVGIVIGFAAQKSLGTLFAGLQIAISQPIRIDDTVVVEDQFGTIGEVTLTYVIVNLWDGRRLVVPISYFLEKPFENWTRISPEVVSKVKVYADHSMPIEPVRQKVKEWLEASPLWDKRSWSVVVTNATETSIEIRASMSAKNSGDAFDLECMMREKLVGFIQQDYPQCLPLTRFKQVGNN